MQALQQCDRVLFLAEGGRVAYFGPPAGAADYFGQADAADVFLALDTEPGQAWKERFRAHPAYERYVTPVVGPPPAWPTPAATVPAPRRAGRLAEPGGDPRAAPRRAAALRPPPPRPARPAGPAARACSCGWCWPATASHAGPATSRLTPGGETVAMFVALSATWLGASNAVREIVKERHIVRREVDAGLAPSAYVAAKVLVLGVITMVQSAVLAIVACIGQRPPAERGAPRPGRVELVAGRRPRRPRRRRPSASSCPRS